MAIRGFGSALVIGHRTRLRRREPCPTLLSCLRRLTNPTNPRKTPRIIFPLEPVITPFRLAPDPRGSLPGNTKAHAHGTLLGHHVIPICTHDPKPPNLAVTAKRNPQFLRRRQFPGVILRRQRLECRNIIRLHRFENGEKKSSMSGLPEGSYVELSKHLAIIVNSLYRFFDAFLCFRRCVNFLGGDEGGTKFSDGISDCVRIGSG